MPFNFHLLRYLLRCHIPGAINVVSLDGGWGIWDRAITLRVVAGETPYDEEFAL